MTERERWMRVSILALVAMIALSVVAVVVTLKSGRPGTRVEQIGR